MVVGDDVSRAARAAADEVGQGVRYRDAVFTVAQGDRSRRVGAYAIAANGRAAGRPDDDDASAAVGREDVSPARFGEADDVADPGTHVDSGAVVAARRRPGRIRPDVVAIDQVEVGAVAQDRDATPVRRRSDHVPRGNRRTADDVVRRRDDPYALVDVAKGARAGNVRADVVPLHDVVRRVPGLGLLDQHADRAVPRDHVPRASGRPADRVVRGPEGDALAGVGKRPRAGGVRSDQVALDRVLAGRGRAEGQERGDTALVSGDEVSRTRGRSPDQAVPDDGDTGLAVADGRGPRRVRPDPVGLDRCAHGRRARRCRGDHSPAGVARDEIPSARRADDVVVADDDDPVSVRDRPRSGSVRTDVVAQDAVSGRAGFDDDAGVGVPGKNISVAGKRSADGVAARRDLDTHEVGLRGPAGDVGPEVAAGREAPRALKRDPGTAETIDRQRTNHGASGGHPQAGGGSSGVVADDLYQWSAREARLRAAVDRDRVGDRGQAARSDVDRERRGPRDVEKDSVGTRHAVRDGDRFAKGARVRRR